MNSIPLQVGANAITITASDAAGNKGLATITVNYQTVDTIRPKVLITTPTNTGSCDCKTQALTIGGTASDNVAVKSITWINSAGGNGVCTGTTSWNANLSLKPGLNVITVTAYDAANNAGTATLRVNYGDATVFPSITINAPTSDSTYWTTDRSLKISGTASDAIALNSVVWSNNRGGAGVCAGTTDWSQAGITLKSGRNIITVTASNVSKNTKVAVLTVMYYDTSTVKWKTGTVMVSLPIIPSATDPKLTVQFKGSCWYAYRPEVLAYSIYPSQFTWFNDYAETSQATPGRGFWAKFGSDVIVPVGKLPDQTQEATIHLFPGWNIIGQPFVTAVNWDLDAIKVKDADRNILAIGSPMQDCVSELAWGWQQNSSNPSTGKYYAIFDPQIIPGAVNHLTPWQAFWILAQKECDLIIPAPLD